MTLLENLFIKNKAFFFLFSAIFFRSAASFCAKKAGMTLDEGHFVSIFSNYWYFLQIICLTLQFYVWMKVLKELDLGVAYSSMSAVVILNYLMGIFIFDEPFFLRQLLGIAIIIVGIFILFIKKPYE